jgi:hypothetical protein
MVTFYDTCSYNGLVCKSAGFIFLEPMLYGAPGLEHRLVSVIISRR